MTKRTLHQGEHPVGEVVLLKERPPIDLALEEGVEAEYRGAPICREDRGAGGAELFEGHKRIAPYL
jgi:hypothetical protein